jgi:hypothetical protein
MFGLMVEGGVGREGRGLHDWSNPATAQQSGKETHLHIHGLDLSLSLCVKSSLC